MKKILWLAVIALAFVALCHKPLFGQEQITVEQISGDSSSYDRAITVYVPIGFTKEQLPEFRKLVKEEDEALNSNLEPCKTLRKSLRTYALMVASKDSGISIPDSGIVRDTFLGGMLQGTVLTVPNSSRDKIKQIATSFIPGFDKLDQIMLVFNSYVVGPYGNILGTANNDLDQISCVMARSLTRQLDTSPNPKFEPWPYTTGHEVIGHGLGKLHDTSISNIAYSSGFREDTSPNVTMVSDPRLVKWKAWFTPNVPVPAPNLHKYQGVVSIFPGAEYFKEDSGLYRASMNSLMGGYRKPDAEGVFPPETYSYSFNPVEAEAVYLAYTRKTGIMDDWFPNNNSTITVESEISFGFVTTRTTLSESWLLDGELINGGSMPLKLDPRKLESGTHELKMMVVDNTPFVRNDPNGLLTTQVVWKLNVPIGTGVPPGPKSADFDKNGVVDLNDFFLFAENFGYRRGQVAYNLTYDLDRDGEVGFTDFFLFADAFGKRV